MFVAIFIVIISGVVYAGGVGNIFEEASKGGRLEFWNFNPDPTVRHTWFTLVIGGAFTYLTLYAVNQTQIQRMMTARSLKDAQKALWISWPILMCLSFTTSFTGLVIYYYYRKCDPIIAGRITSQDQIMPMYVVDALSHIPGISGLFVAGIYSASLSTVSSCLNSLAAVTLEDYLKPLYKLCSGHNLKLSDSRSAIPSKIIAGIYGIICIGVAFIAQSFGAILQVSLTIFGTVGGPIFALFTLGMSTMSANEPGAVFGLFSGIIFSMWIGFSKKPPAIQLPKSVEDCSQFGLYNVTKNIPEKASENIE
jgi:solute carrier family 5 (sodium-coupled monocarboxylate transporter), member 8/12